MAGVRTGGGTGTVGGRGKVREGMKLHMKRNLPLFLRCNLI